MQQTADNTNHQNNQTHLAVGYQLDQYEIESIATIGDFRITYYARDNRHDRNVVIHEYFPKSLAIRENDSVSVTSVNKDRFTDYEFGLSEFLLEARLVSQIHSAYLPNIIEYHESNGTGYLVSEYDDGRSLREILDNASTLVTDNELNELLKASLQGLRELHSRNLLHTSVSPTNLFVRDHGHPILLGHGLARYRLAQYTKIYPVSLAPGYTPLEQYGLDGNIGPWSDLYALGASLYECISGARPVDASTRHTALIKGDDDPLTPAVELGGGRYSNILLTNIDWMLKTYVEDRPDSADLMLGVVSFQRQNKNTRSLGAQVPIESIETRKNEETFYLVKPEKKNNLENKLVNPEKDISQYQPHRSGKLVYWGLGLTLLAFLAVTGYQIYQHEIKNLDTRQAQAMKESQPLPESEPSSSNQSPAEQPASNEKEFENRTISQDSDDERREFYENLVKEEEVKRRVEEELKAREAEIQAQELARVQAQQEEINSLLTNAKSAKENFNLLKPDGESAFDYYSSVLEMDPENKPAMSGLGDIADIYFSFAIKAIEDNDPDKAGKHLKNLITVRPSDPRLEGFLLQISDLKAKLKFDEEKRILQAELVEDKRLAPKIENEPESEINTVKQEIKEPIAPVSVQTQTKEPEKQQAITEMKEDQSVVSQIQLSTAYNTYDTGQYSNNLFNTMFDAANKDEGRAQYILAEMYAAGRGIEQNFAESTFWLKRSLDHVNKNAKYRQPWAEKAMGVIYEKGWYVDSDTARAVRWYQSSADKGYGPAQYRLGLAYAKGLGVNKDVEKAEFWFKKALSNGHQEAKKALSKIPTQN